ncbi:MAG: hypothetical protein COY78_05595 [Candidatus Omnitrophica bacterium CG_4_10_14_0_8_um_filter_44_12]|nr:MAG: hypothetical protein COY78_05595 [Candidatus Omnitrophica bacterium CG_4_10_14_0_8_um_filter_44_12]
MKEKYDVAIIGAGIGGLICGCYLAKAGIRVLIVEQHNKPGGYCSSFYHKGYKFDVGVHYLGSLGKKGTLRAVFNELDLDLETIRIDPSDKIITPDKICYIRSKVRETIDSFKKEFPLESKKIESFFSFILESNFINIYRKTLNLSFSNFLDLFFSDYRLKGILSLLLGNIGLFAETAHAMAAIIFYRQYILDSGYYPKGGMQSFPNRLLEKFISLQGECIFQKKIIKITANKDMKSVILDCGKKISAKIVVSDADAYETFNELIDIECPERDKIKKMEFSASMFLIYLGLRTNIVNTFKEKSNIWYLNSYKINEMYNQINYGKIPNKINCILCSFCSFHDKLLPENKDKISIVLGMIAPYKTKVFWDLNKTRLAKRMINDLQPIIGNIENIVDVELYATPQTFYRYTLNKKGSYVGLLATTDQVNFSFLPQRTSIRGIYRVGHWCSLGYIGNGGIPNVAFSGRKGAMLVLDELKTKWPVKKNYFKSLYD